MSKKKFSFKPPRSDLSSEPSIASNPNVAALERQYGRPGSAAT